MPDLLSDRLGLLRRRRLGLTVGQLLPIVRDLKARGLIDDDNPSAAAVAVAAHLHGVDPAWQAEAKVGADWDAILDFIERLIPLILKLIALFGG